MWGSCSFPLIQITLTWPCKLGGDNPSSVLPFCSVVLNRTPGLDLTGFEGVVVVWNTSAGPSACKKVFKTDKNCGKIQTNQAWRKILWGIKTVPWPLKSTSPSTQSESLVQLALATLKYWNKTDYSIGSCVLVDIIVEKLLLTSHLSAGSLPLIMGNFSSQYCTNDITTLWGKCHKNTISQ